MKVKSAVAIGLGIGIGIALALAGCATTRPLPMSALLPKLETTRIENVRVLLVKGTMNATLSSPAAVDVYDAESRAKLGEVHLTGKLACEVRDRRFFINNRACAANPVRLVPASGEFLQVNGRRYRGQMEINWDPQTGMTIINYVPLEAYLKGVVPNEMYPKSPLEALKAQAVASRTFALSRMNAGSRQAWDVDAGTNSQVYSGLDSEKPATSQSVEETRGLVISYQGRFISAFYHSNCGGSTSNVREVWGSEAPYLQGVACGFCARSRHASWSAEISKPDLSQRLRQHNIIDQDCRALEIAGRDASGRVTTLRIRTSSGQETIKAAALRMMLGPDKIRSTHFQVREEGSVLLFQGKGWGHGVGLCQEGAEGMARAGYRMEEILGRYYPGTSLSRLD